MTSGLVNYLKYWLNIFKHAAQIWLESNAFANAGSLALLLLWVNHSSLILLYGAAFTKAHLLASGRQVQPRNVAVRFRREIIED
jgi:uncharacterized BrkB/YihY/UPF0761 family membrane protein